MASEGKPAGDHGSGDHRAIAPKDVAAATAVGSATRLGVRRHKARQAAVGAAAAGSPRQENERGRLVTAAIVIVVTLGLLGLMMLRNS